MGWDALNDDYLPGSVWTYLDAAAVFVGGLIGGIVGVAIGIAVAGNDISNSTQLISAGIGQAIAVLAISFYLSLSKGTASWDVDFGLRFQPRDLFGIAYGVILQILVVLFVLEPIRIVLQIEDPPQQSAVDTAAEIDGLPAKLAVVLIFVILAPLTEEILYRGIILGRARRTMSPRNALILSSAVFAGIHLIDPDAIFAIPGLFVVGLVLGYQALRTGRIGLSIATHAGFNLLTTLVIVFDVSLS